MMKYTLRLFCVIIEQTNQIVIYICIVLASKNRHNEVLLNHLLQQISQICFP